MNPWVINRNEEVFGPNTDKFIPERWLKYDHETEEQFNARLMRMKGCDLTFGAGSRVCLGRYLSQFESYKLIATMFTKFDVSSRRSSILSFHPCPSITTSRCFPAFKELLVTNIISDRTREPQRRMEDHQLLVRQTGEHPGYPEKQDLNETVR